MDLSMTYQSFCPTQQTTWSQYTVSHDKTPSLITGQKSKRTHLEKSSVLLLLPQYLAIIIVTQWRSLKSNVIPARKASELPSYKEANRSRRQAERSLRLSNDMHRLRRKYQRSYSHLRNLTATNLLCKALSAILDF